MALYDYDTALRSCYGIVDDQGNIVPLEQVGWYGVGHGDVLDIRPLLRG